MNCVVDWISCAWNKQCEHLAIVFRGFMRNPKGYYSDNHIERSSCSSQKAKAKKLSSFLRKKCVGFFLILDLKH